MKRLAAVLMLVVLIAVPIVMAQKGNPNPGVLPPNSDAHGMTYAEWSARWWQWVTSQPLDANPLNDTLPCSGGQIGKVWFLGGAFGSHAQPLRYCEVPVGTSLFIAVIDVDCSTLEIGTPYYGGTPEERQACVKYYLSNIDNVAIEIDGVPVKNPDMYRIISGDFNFILPADPNNNVLYVPGGNGIMAAGGIYLLLTPMPKGEHIIHFKGTFENAVPPFTAEQYYHVIVTDKH